MQIDAFKRVIRNEIIGSALQESKSPTSPFENGALNYIHERRFYQRLHDILILTTLV